MYWNVAVAERVDRVGESHRGLSRSSSRLSLVSSYKHARDHFCYGDNYAVTPRRNSGLCLPERLDDIGRVSPSSATRPQLRGRPIFVTKADQQYTDAQKRPTTTGAAGYPPTASVPNARRLPTVIPCLWCRALLPQESERFASSPAQSCARAGVRAVWRFPSPKWSSSRYQDAESCPRKSYGGLR